MLIVMSTLMCTRGPRSDDEEAARATPRRPLVVHANRFVAPKRTAKRVNCSQPHATRARVRAYACNVCLRDVRHPTAVTVAEWLVKIRDGISLGGEDTARIRKGARRQVNPSYVIRFEYQRDDERNSRFRRDYRISPQVTRHSESYLIHDDSYCCDSREDTRESVGVHVLSRSLSSTRSWTRSLLSTAGTLAIRVNRAPAPITSAPEVASPQGAVIQLVTRALRGITIGRAEREQRLRVASSPPGTSLT